MDLTPYLGEGPLVDGLHSLGEFVWQWKLFLLVGCMLLRNWLDSRKPFPEHPNAKVEKLKDVADYDRFLAQNGPCVIDFYAVWCPPCRKSSVEYGEMSEEYGGNWRFAKVDVDAAPDIARKVGVSSMPTFKLYESGKELQTIVGFQSATMRAVLNGRGGLPGVEGKVGRKDE